ncbi:hypothetical protein [Methylocystis echinoides]|uniref:hypothetical protein n=1 Tax=Methylocystis echinoides TaxID=29468 RepID=UPI00342BA466
MLASAPTGNPSESPRVSSGGDRSLSVLMIAALLSCAALLVFPQIEAVWGAGAFFDSDDAMRAVQLRDFLAGQGWFDLTAYRLDPPSGQITHWSRVVDVPLAGLTLAFRAFLSPEFAERATRLVFPFALLAALLALAGWLAALLSGAATRHAAIWLTALSGPMFLQFAPGRIDHHAPQIVTLLAALCFLLQGLDPRQAPRLAVCAALMALSLAISLENLPFFIVMASAPALLFVRDGAAARAQLLCFAAGALVAFPALYVATVPRAAYLQLACDAFSIVHLAAILAGGLALLVLAALAPQLATARARAGVLLVAGAASLAGPLLVAPHCLGDPLGGLDPLLRQLWLAHVTEALSLSSIFAKSPGASVAVALPVALGLCCALAFAGFAHGLARRRWLLVAGAIGVGLAAGMWQIRVFSSATPLAMAPLAAAIVRVLAPLEVASALRAALVGVVCALVSPIGLALALSSSEAAGPGGERACLKPHAFDFLATLPPSRVLASFSLGSHVLAHTAHSVFAAPYHRNNHGNRIAADIFLAPPEKAEGLARRAGAGLVLWCAATGEPSPLATAAPAGLAAMLERGEAPLWLERLSPDGAPLLVFALRPVE